MTYSTHQRNESSMHQIINRQRTEEAVIDMFPPPPLPDTFGSVIVIGEGDDCTGMTDNDDDGACCIACGAVAPGGAKALCMLALLIKPGRVVIFPNVHLFVFPELNTDASAVGKAAITLSANTLSTSLYSCSVSLFSKSLRGMAACQRREAQAAWTSRLLVARV